MSALSSEPTVSVTMWANEQGWGRLRCLLICRLSLLLNCKWTASVAMLAHIGWPEGIAHFARVVLRLYKPTLQAVEPISVGDLFAEDTTG